MPNYRLIPVLLLSMFAAVADAQCTGLCLKQVACNGGATTSISGKVYAPNGTDPLPSVVVFIPNTTVAPMPAGVSCLPPGTPPSGSPLVGTSTAPDGSFQITNVPAGTDIPLVIQSGKWRRQVVVPAVTACADTPFSTRMPRNQSEGDIPLIAIVTGQEDAIECSLRVIGVDDAEFTNANSTGRIHLYPSNDLPGVGINANTPREDVLMGDINTLKKYDILMLPSTGQQSTPPAAEVANMQGYADSGGRVFISHLSDVWLANSPAYKGVADWNFGSVDARHLSHLGHYGQVSSTFSEAKILIPWLNTVGASDPNSGGAIIMAQPYLDTLAVHPPAEIWLYLASSLNNDPMLQLSFNTPFNSQVNQCGRVLYADYTVSNGKPILAGQAFPKECAVDGTTNESKLLEYSLFDLSTNGAPPTLSPASADFGTEFVGGTSAPQVFTLTNNSIFGTSVSSASTSNPVFAITANTCSYVAPKSTCQITVVFQPTSVGAVNSVLTVASGGAVLTAPLTGNGTPGLDSTKSIDFGKVDVGATATGRAGISNLSQFPVSMTGLSITGGFVANSQCGSFVAPGSACVIDVTFAPTSTGLKTGVMTFGGGKTVTLTGTGVDFNISLSPDAGNTIAGVDKKVDLNILGISGFASTVTVTCVTTAPGSTCTPTSRQLVPGTNSGDGLTIATTSKYTVIGYEGAGAGLLAGFGAISGLALLFVPSRRRTKAGVLHALVFSLGCLGLAACSEKQPARNALSTPPGTYTYTVSVSDAFVRKTATYTLTVTAQ